MCCVVKLCGPEPGFVDIYTSQSGESPTASVGDLDPEMERILRSLVDNTSNIVSYRIDFQVLRL